MQMAEFKFSNKLMEEHFNENYMESEISDQVFSGKLTKKLISSKDGTYDNISTGWEISNSARNAKSLY
jgi:hypothetical protein